MWGPRPGSHLTLPTGFHRGGGSSASPLQPSALLPAADQHVSGDLGFSWQKLYLPVLWEGSRHSWSAQGHESSQSSLLTDWNAAPSWEPPRLTDSPFSPEGPV